MSLHTKRMLQKYSYKAMRFILLAIFILIVILPLYWLFITSLKAPEDIATMNIQYWPKNPTFANYDKVWNTSRFSEYLQNSILVSGFSALIVLFISILGGYGLARYAFKMKQVTMIGFLVSQMIPVTLLLIPLYMMFANLKLIDTRFGLILLYMVFNAPFCIITMQGFFMNIPKAIEEAAQIDGASKVQMMCKVILPMMLPGIISVYIFAFVGAWNELLGGIMFINSEALKTIPVGLNSYVGQFAVNWGEMTAGGILAIIPTVVLFAFAQKYIVEGLTAGSVKG